MGCPFYSMNRALSDVLARFDATSLFSRFSKRGRRTKKGPPKAIFYNFANTEWSLLKLIIDSDFIKN